MITMDDLPRIVVPLLDMAGKPLPMLGSGFFFERGENIFLVTATHVIEDMLKEPTRIRVPISAGPQTELNTIGGGRMLSVPANQEDVTIFRLENESMISDVRSGWRVLTYADVEKVSMDHAVICGFPHARLRPQDDGYRGTLMTFNSRLMTAPPKGVTLRNGDMFLTWLTHPEEPVPKLPGISGSPVWAHRGYELTLAGVQHTVSHGEYVRGTMWSVVDFMLRHRFPVTP